MYMFSCAKKIPLQLKNDNKQIFDDVFLQMQLKNKKVGIVGLDDPVYGYRRIYLYESVVL